MKIEDKHERYYDWLAQVKEEIIDPELPIIDPHHHLWNGDNQLAGSFSIPNGTPQRRYELRT